MIYPRDDIIWRGRKTVLRRKRASDIHEDYAWRRDEELAKLDATLPLRMPFDDYARNWYFDMRYTDITTRYFAIEDESGRRIGNVMYYNLDRVRKEAEVGISIGYREAWGQGYGSDALRAAVYYILSHTELKRLYLRTLEWNQRAQRAFLKAGFQYCGTS
ncbi:MAG TPA: GNAT family N-acetyltransferase, partial [Dehalococcoidia bacterium]|nr:GNAT family N-acetyltransferase [Dehalococcoidia bacterium]